MNRSIAITGANGFVGRNVCKFLLENNIEVTSIVRTAKKTIGNTMTSKDLSEDFLAQKIHGYDALLHFIGRGKQTADTDYEYVNVQLTRNAITLCKKAKIPKIIYISGLGVNKNTTLGYFISKYKAEQDIIHSGLDYTIFRPSYIIGRDDPLSVNLRKQMKSGTVIIPGSGNYRLQPIFVQDVANIMMKSLYEKRFSNKIIDLVGPQIVSYNRFVRDFCKVSKTRIKKVDFETVFHDALHNKGSFGVYDLGIMVGDYIGDYRELARLTQIRFTKYEEVLEPGSSS